VHTYRSGETGLFVNSYLIESGDGVVAIDTPLLLSDGRAFRARLEALRKPLLGVLVTHPHPDHYNTIGLLLAGEDVPVIAHRDVDREIREKDEAKRAQWGPVFGDEWPASATFPSRTAADEESVDFGDLLFTAWDFGSCESASETVWLLGDGVSRSSVTWPSTALTPSWRMDKQTPGSRRSTERRIRSPAFARSTSATGLRPRRPSSRSSAATC
jgi:glyoxylase-like metal-dependent hydrolase (beta-lactamase superfamily II)